MTMQEYSDRMSDTLMRHYCTVPLVKRSFHESAVSGHSYIEALEHVVCCFVQESAACSVAATYLNEHPLCYTGVAGG